MGEKQLRNAEISDFKVSLDQFIWVVHSCGLSFVSQYSDFQKYFVTKLIDNKMNTLYFLVHWFLKGGIQIKNAPEQIISSLSG